MKFRGLILLLAATGCALAAEQEVLTIEEAVRLAAERYPDVARAKAAAEGLKGRIREVRAQALPDVSINVNGMRMRDPSFLNASGLDKFPEELRKVMVPSPVNLFDYNISVRQPLYTAGKVGTALRIASIESEGAQVDVDRARQDLSVEVVRACYGLLWAARYKLLVVELQKQRKMHADMARQRFQNGVATEVDVLRSEVALANVTPDLVRAENNIRQARALLNFYLGRPLDFPTRIAGDFQQQPWEQWDLEKLSLEALRSRPELQRLRIAERSAQAQLQLAQAESKMRADLSGAYGLASRYPEKLIDPLYARWSVGVSFTLPVFDGFRRNGMVQQAVAQQRATRLEREKT